MKSILFGLALLFSVVTDSFPQKPPAKFGDISMNDLKMESYEKDTAAAAVVLVDYGEVSLEYDQEYGFYLSFERLRRIKVLKKDGLKFGDFLIPIYKSGAADEKLTQLKAATQAQQIVLKKNTN